jgi:hypothetical protein
MSEMFHIHEFFDDTPNPRCCFKWFHNDRLPLYNIPESDTFYPDQSEVIIPFDTVTEFVNVDIQSAVLFRDRKPPVRTIQNQELYRTATHQDSDLETTAINVYYYRVLSRTIKRELMDFINLMLKKYYFCDGRQNEGGGRRGTAHDWKHISSVIIVGCALYSGICDGYEIDTRQDEYEILILACLFHDSGRDCRDGEDFWEPESALIAKKEISYFQPIAHLADKVYQVLTGQGKETLYKVYLAYKGADSVDIGRVKAYRPEYNPLQNLIKAKDTPTKLVDALTHLIDEDTVIKYNVLTETIYYLTTGNKSYFQFDEPKTKEDAWYDVQFSNYRKVQDSIYYQTTVSVIDAAGPQFAELYTGTSFQELTEDSVGDWGEAKNYFTPLDPQDIDLLKKNGHVEAAKKYMANLKEIVHQLPVELERLINDLDGPDRFGAFPSNGQYLFDYYCTLFNSLVHFHPLYHKYISYIKFPFYARASQLS